MTVYCVVGYPGSGKSEAASIADELGYQTFSMGNCVKKRAREELGEDIDSDAIGEWATEQREKHGKSVVAEWTLDKIEKNIAPQTEVIVIDGLRSLEALKKFEEAFLDVRLLYVSAPRWLRLLRLKERGRDGEDAFTLQDMKERDEREDDWGVKSLLEERSLIEIENTASLTIFQEKIQEVLHKHNI